MESWTLLLYVKQPYMSQLQNRWLISICVEELVEKNKQTEKNRRWDETEVL